MRWRSSAKVGLVGAALLLIQPGCARARYGDLPAGAVETLEFRGVRAEITLTYAIHPDLVTSRMPTGVRAFLVRDLPDSAKMALLADRPELAEYAFAHIGFIAVDDMMLDGRPRPAADAFWWVYVVGTDSTTTAPMSLTRIRAQGEFSSVSTYYGHHLQHCDGDWSGFGNGELASSLRH